MTPEEFEELANRVTAFEAFREKTERNKRIQARYDELMGQGKHGHLETMFKIVHEEIERDRKNR